jgi:hypothetical protein
MKVSDALSAARDAVTVKRVFAEPYEKDGLTVIVAQQWPGAREAAPERIPTDSRARAEASVPAHDPSART